MKTLAFTIVLAFVSILGFSQEKNGSTITVTIDQIKNDKGHILLGLHSKETFMKAEALQQVKSEIKDGKILATFTNVQPGSYAILALHDENDNGNMDFESNGMPIETFGTSNNPQGFGPPQFNTSKFEIKDKNIEMNIELK